MFGSSLEYNLRQDSRPTKRPRNTSLTAELQQATSTSNAFSDDHSINMEMAGDRISAATRTDDTPPRGPTGARARNEEKNNRTLSCKECRRQVTEIYPTVISFIAHSMLKYSFLQTETQSALTSGRGSRFILAGAEQLHEKILELSDRIKQLEEALEAERALTSSHPHPLLAPDLLKIKTSQEIYSPPTVSNLPSSSSNSDISNARDEHLRQSIGAMSLHSQPPYAEGSRPPHPEALSNMNVAPDILQLSTTFPFPWAVDITIRKRIRDSLPPRAEALRLCEEARNNALWQFTIDSSKTFLPNLLRYCYETPIEALSPRRLALLLMHLSIGSLVDLNSPLGSLNGEAYHHLARASVCEIPLMEEPDFDVLHALFFMIWYHLIFSDNKKAVGYAWNLMGFVAKLAQGLGLHKEAPKTKTLPEEHEKRRAVFWELLNMDCRMCLSPMLEAMVAVDRPEYSRIIILDKSVRDFGVPTLLDEHQSHDVNPRFLVMQRGLVSISREIALLQLHRRYFTEAMNGPESFDLGHPYAPSVIATYLGASNLISAVETLFEQEAQLTARFLHFWFNSFSAMVTLSLLISRAPSTSLASYAFQDLGKGCRLFKLAAAILPFSGKALPVVQKLLDKSQRVLLQRRAMDPSQTHDMIYPQPQPQLPPSFMNVHFILSQLAERIEARDPCKRLASSSSADLQHSSLNTEQESWPSDIYQFSSVGLNVEERYSIASTQPTPFIPSSPRVAQNEKFNFDHGALRAGLVEETSYMAWF
ncbi:hypothetical protein JR316_0006779 [Psilocybe cubensis]|uniref:Uncharacterized protein n=1 Tax=Psilocybe cubensis TaxID=181762 RepID=A0ACB8GX81_PSICU|nr:hypothetical protein JR316_0006779 [Psilocybe cubensis]KAH9480181.1 hypothetical protein JR316_0006779 [Psilocybe cubensis]